ncbi:MAG TPA: NHLP bacteriocin system secretion protein [Ramlibacter sp.]|uniref:NHLP bacteriocin system secretion protein n=1 Tax=Ramlibacter sp. TaxID=1917967 RepID=UPI002CFF1148|nr:NHLP bacteriocin system secretion protein [Ramlibacter sp.]HVZ43768.1 NHLP bacteriocin system secretion protein [Ramlibacter sp.]
MSNEAAVNASDTRAKLFRKVALDRLSSPEQLDTMVRVVTVNSWLTLAPLIAILLMALAWSIWGSIPTKVVGRAILFQSDGLRDVTTGSPGRIEQMAVRIGDVVAPGQTVAVLSQPELQDQLRTLTGRLDELLRQQAEQQNQTTRAQGLAKRLIAQQRFALQGQLAAAQERVRVMGERLKTQQTLLDQGLITRQAYLDTQNELARSRQEVESVQSSLQGTSLRGAEDDKRDLQELTRTANQIGETRRSIASVQAAIAIASKVVSAYAGRVVELKVATGGLVSRGTALVTLEPADGGAKTLEAVIFIPAAEGKKVEPGMEAQIEPSTVKREEAGFMLGRVRYVSDYAATDESMFAILRNRQLVQELSAGSSPIEVRASLLPGDTASGYRWSSGNGPDFKVRTGTLGTAEIVVRRQPPIALVVPWLRKSLGID